MADNYLEKRYAEVFGSGAKKQHQRPSLDVLLSRNRSFRGFCKDYVVHARQLEAMVAVAPKLASGMNRQCLRFRLVTKGQEASKVLEHIHLGGALPELGLPLPGTEPEAFIVVCSTCPENAVVDMDLGICVQSMLLKAVEMNLGGVIVRNFDKAALKEALQLPLAPLVVLAVGKPAEKVELVRVRAGEPLAYYRSGGVHYVPKIVAEDLII